MQWDSFGSWLDHTPFSLLIALIVVLMAAAAGGGYALRRGAEQRGGPAPGDNQEAYVVSAVLGLLALLMGFSLAMALDRYEARRALVLQEANAIGTAYLRTQLLEQPHRERLSGLLASYLDTRIALAKVAPGSRDELLHSNDQLLTELWAATAAAFDEIKGLPFSVGYLDSMNALIDLDTSRKTARMARVPPEVFVLLLFFILLASAVLGNVLKGRRKLAISSILLLFLLLALMMIFDIDRPTAGFVNESQQPMEALQAGLKSTPVSAYDTWRQPGTSR